MSEGALNGFRDAVARALEGQTAVVLVDSPVGSADALVELIPDSLPVHGRVACAPVCSAIVGGVADDLALESFAGGALVLEDAQWADPTSLGRLQRMVKDGVSPLLLIVAHRSLRDEDLWWLGPLANTARDSGHVSEISLPAPDSEFDATGLDAKAVEMLIASRLITGTLSVQLAADFLAMSEEGVLALGDDLMARGLLRQARGGYLPSPDVPIDFAGEARTGFVAGRLAEAVQRAGGPRSLVGNLLAAGGRASEAFPVLAVAAAEAEQRHATGEAFHLASAALAEAEEAGITDRGQLGRLHLIAGKFLRAAGRTRWAAEHLEHASASLEGAEKVDALRFAAAVADDAQHPQDAERIAAMAELAAAGLDDRAEWGSLLTFRARSLNRIGFAAEADAALLKGEGLLTEGSAEQRFYAWQNRAWIHFDRGEPALAEATFTRLRDESGRLEDEVSLADKEAWRARALFPAGRPDEALEAVEVVYRVAALEDVQAPVFLAQLALTEGGLAYGQYEQALEASERVLDLVERQLPAWENMARSLRATAFLRLGRGEEAREEIERALSLTPEGANGWRWRARCQALSMEIETALGRPWPSDAADVLADQMLQARLHGWAAELLCAIAEHGKRKKAAEEATAVAVKAGTPLIAARAVHAGGLWDSPFAIPVILAIRAIDRRVPAGWEEGWRNLPHVAAGLSRPEPAEDEESAVIAVAMEEALRRAGLSGDETALSPAQRRARGLVTRRGNRLLRTIAAALGVVVLAAGTALGIAQLTQDEAEPTATTAAQATAVATSAPILEETLVERELGSRPPSGTAEHRGGPSRTGVFDTAGPREVAGYYWRVPTAGPIEASPVAYGRYIYVGTTEGTFYALDQANGDVVWTMPPEGRISVAPALGEGDAGEGQTPTIVVVVDDDGVVRGHDAADANGISWNTSLGSRIRSSPVVAGGVAYIGTDAGFVHALRLVDGGELWRYPEAAEGIGEISADLAFRDGLLYVGTQTGMLQVVDVSGEAPQPVCQFDASAPIVANPMIVDDIVYVPTTGQNIWVLPFGACDGVVPDRLPFYVTETPVEVPPAIVGDTMYLPDGLYLYAKDLVSNTDVWPANTVNPDRPVSAPPVVAGDTLYFGSEDGVVHAVDSTTGEALWRWRTGLHVRGAPAIVEGVVYIVSGDGFVYAVGS